MELYLSDGQLPISNVHVERRIRLIALIRKNSLFFGSLDAGKCHANLLTLVINCALADVNPYAYFVELFRRIGGTKARNVASLLPKTLV